MNLAWFATSDVALWASLTESSMPEVFRMNELSGCYEVAGWALLVLSLLGGYPENVQRVALRRALAEPDFLPALHTLAQFEASYVQLSGFVLGASEPPALRAVLDALTLPREQRMAAIAKVLGLEAGPPGAVIISEE